MYLYSIKWKEKNLFKQIVFYGFSFSSLIWFSVGMISGGHIYFTRVTRTSYVPIERWYFFVILILHANLILDWGHF